MPDEPFFLGTGREEIWRSAPLAPALNIGALIRLPGELRGRVGGMPGRRFRLQCSSDLEVWTDLGTFTTAPAQTLSLPVAPDEPRRFYRIVAP